MRQFVTSVYIFQNDHDGPLILLHPHRKLGKWLPPGGHLEIHETPPEAARREVKEETGLEIELILQENLWVDAPNAKSIERPFLCLLEKIPPFGDQPAHEHIDFIFAARPIGQVESMNGEFRWFTLEECRQLDLFDDTRKVLPAIAAAFMNVLI